MQYTDHRLLLDVCGSDSCIVLRAKQNDTGRRLRIALTERGTPYPVGETVTAIFTARKPDGNKLYTACVLEQGEILYPFTPQTTAVPGCVECEIRLYDGDDLLTSARFRILVEQAIYTEGEVVESVTEQGGVKALVTAAIEEYLEENPVQAGPPGPEGEPGLSAYELALQQGYEGDLESWLGSLKGEPGAQGIQGEKGDKGETGAAGADGKNGADGYTPVRGRDYWTAADIAEIKGYVEEAILGGAW